MRIALRRLGALFTLLAALPAFGVTAPLPSVRYKLAALGVDASLAVPALDHQKALAEDAKTAGKGVPLRYAVGAKVDAVARDAQGKSNAGRWQTLPDGRALWRMSVYAPGALSLDFGFTRMFLPHGAELYIADLSRTTVRGPYTDADNTRAGAFWTPIVPGDTALVEVVVPAELRHALVLELGTVHSGYRNVLTGESPYEKSLSCNIDSVCPQGDSLRNQIRGVAGYTFDGRGGDGVVCTGQLLNNTRQDNRRLFSSARHCVSTQSTANTVVVYWKYESPTCRTPGSAASGIPISLAVAVPQTGGSTLLATHAGTDMTLLELNSAVPAAANVFFNGWDRRDTVPSNSAIIHHSAGDEKRLSFDFNPAVLNTGPESIENISYVARGSVDVTYDLATTEGGASGGALFDSNGRVVGQLGGGPAGSCSVDITDIYGRFAIAWEGGGTPDSRLRDWLDPVGTGTGRLNGNNDCASPQITLIATPGTGRAGEAVNYSASISGTGPYRVDWDIDDDDITDRTQNGVTGHANLSAVYPAATTTDVIVRATDPSGCVGQAQRTTTITAPDIVASAQPAMQVCGDNDAAIEPGERWRVPVNLSNVGAQAINGGYAVFARGNADPGGGGGFGYRVLDNTTAGCGFQFIDISAQPQLTLIASGANAPAEDDGHTAAQPLGPGGFNFFGQNVSSVVMSTNGYLSADAAENGGDFRNSCDIQPDDGGRFNVLHDDLVVNPGGGLRRAYFPTCPRPGDAGATLGCTVFTWTNLEQFEGGGNAEFQALLYDQTFEIVYQYRIADPSNGADATVGIRNIGGTEQTQYSCNEARAPAGRAVCLFHPDALPPSLSAAGIRLFTPAVALPNLAAGAQATASATFQVDAGASCGASLGLNYVGTVDNVAHSLRSASILNTTLGAGGPCQTFAGTCAEPVPAVFTPRDGLYSNLVRFGNGMGAFNIPVGGGTTIFGGQWYTGNRDRTPTWLIIQGEISDNQADVPVYRSIQTGSAPFAVERLIVGRAQISYVSATDYVATWTVDGVAAGERLTFLYGPNRPSPDRTGAWYFAQESGWGLTLEDHFLPNGEPEQVILNYLFDAAGNPVWTIGGSPNRTSGTMAQTMARVHCPSCPSLPDYGSQSQNAGVVNYDYSSLTRGTYSTNLSFPAPVTGIWIRNNVPIENLTPTVPQ